MSITNQKMNISTIIFKHGTKEQLNSSTYVPAEGEIITCTDAAILKVGDGTSTLAELPVVGSVEIIDDYTSTNANAGLSAAKGKDLNDRISALSTSITEYNSLVNSITTIDCGELPVEETEDPEQQSGE